MRNKFYLFSICLLLSLPQMMGQVVLNLPDFTVSCDDVITVPVTVENFTDLSGLSFSLEWDPSVFEYVDNSAMPQLTPDPILNVDNTANGALGFAWVNIANGTTITDGSTIFSFQLKVIGTVSSSNINFASEPIEIAAFDDAINGQTVNLNNGEITIANPCEDTAEPLQISCPPAMEVAAIAGQASVSLSNLTPTFSANAIASTLSYSLSRNGRTIGGNTGDASGEIFTVGQTMLVYTILDAAGNSTTCSTIITVNPPPSNSNTVTFLAESRTATCSSDTEACIDIIANNFESLSDVQFSINWNPAILQFDSLDNNDDALDPNLGVFYGMASVNNGILNVTWSDVEGDGHTLVDGTTLMTLCFTPIGAGSTSIAFTDNQTPIEVFRFVNNSLEEEVTDLSLLAGTIAVTDCGTTTGGTTTGGTTTGGTTTGGTTTGGTTTGGTTTGGTTTGGTTTGGTTTGGTTTDFTLRSTSATGQCSDTQLCIDVSADNFEMLSDVQFSVNWNSSVLSFLSVTNNDAALDPTLGVFYGQNQTDNGILNFTWSDVEGDGHTLADGTRLFTLCFTPIGNGTTGIDFTDNSTPIEVFQFIDNSNVTEVNNVALVPGSITVTNCDAPPTGDAFTVTSGSNSAQCTDDMVCIDVTADNFESLSDIQFSVNWDVSIMEFISVTNNDAALDPNLGALYGQTQTNNGILNFTWSDVEGDGHTLADGTVLFTLCFRPVGNGTATIDFTNNMTPIEVFRYINDSTVEEVTDLQFNVGTISVENCVAGANDFALAVTNVNADCSMTDNVCVDIFANNFTSLSDVQFSVNWEAANLQFVSVTNNDAALDPNLGALYGQTQTANGILNFTWSDVEGDGHTLADGTRLFTLCFNVVGTGSNEISFTDNMTPIEVFRFINNSTEEEVSNIQLSTGTITLVDTEGPVASNCPTAPIVVFTTFDNCLVTGTWTEPTFIDVCSGFEVQRTHIPGDIFGLGEQTIQYTAVDDVGNITVCSFLLTVRDTIAPTITNCPNNQTKDLSAATDCSATATWGAPTVTDACSANPIVTSSMQPGDTFPMGTTLVSYTAIDGSGNLNTTCSFEVTITGEAPVRIAGCPDNIVLSFSSETGCDLSVNWSPPILINGCSTGETLLTSNFDPGDQFPLGTTLVTYTAADEGGNTQTCEFEVTITGSSEIVFVNCPGTITVNALQNQCGATVGWSVPTTTGGCGQPVLVSNFQPNDFFPVGTTVVEYIATDDVQQQSVCNFSVTVIDDQSLIAICPTDITVDAGGNVLADASEFIESVTFDDCGSYRIQYGDIEAFDNCSSTISRSLIQGLQSNSIFGFGATAMSFDITSASGESINCSFNIMVEDLPVIEASLSAALVCEGQEIELRSTGFEGATYSWAGPVGFTSNAQNPIINSPTFNNSGTYTVTTLFPNGCSVTNEVNIQVNTAPGVEASANDLECGGGVIELVAIPLGEDIPGIVWSWTGPNGFTSSEQNPTINDAVALQAGVYTVEGTSPNGCVAVSEVEVNISTITPPTVAPSGLLTPGVACEGQPFNLKGNVYPEPVVYNWTASNSGAGLPMEVDDSLITVIPTNVGEFTYTYTVDLGGGCVADTSIIINVMPSPLFTVSSNSPISCATDTTVLMLSTETDDPTISEWAWEGPDEFVSPFQNPLIADVTGETAGNYIVTATSINGCMATDSIAVEITQMPPIPEVNNDGSVIDRLIVCEGNEISLSVVDTVPGITYSWTGPNDFTSNEATIVIPNALSEASGGYQLTQTIDSCTSEPATVLVVVLVEPEVNDDLIPNLYNEEVEFEIISNDTLEAGAGFSINLPNDTTNSGILVNEAGTVTSNGDGSFNFSPVQDWIGKNQFLYEVCYEECPQLCSMAAVTIDTDVPTDECFIPGVLSPNGDDKNDALIISCNSDPPKGGGIIIFNQWGSKVFEAFPYSNDWSGTYQGDDLPDGVYFYIYSQTDNDPEPVKGCVTIFR